MYSRARSSSGAPRNGEGALIELSGFDRRRRSRDPCMPAACTTNAAARR